jgi:hypothetical protein
LPSRQREEVLNVKLAECICDRGMAAAPENILNTSRARAMPDVIVSVSGLRCMIEGKMGDVQNARELVAKDARERVATGIAHLAVAVVYPAFLRQTPFMEVKGKLADATLDFLVCSEAMEGNWKQGKLDSILDELRRAHDALGADDVLNRSVKQLQAGMQDLVDVLSSHRAASIRLADLLGVYQEAGEANNGDEE